MFTLIRQIMQNPDEVRILAETIPLDDYPEDLADAEASLEDKTERDELNSALWSAINELPYRDKEMLLMTVLENQSQNTVAKRFGVTQSFVSSRLESVLSHLRRQLKSAYEGME